MAIAMS
jgi:integrase